MMAQLDWYLFLAFDLYADRLGYVGTSMRTFEFESCTASHFVMVDWVYIYGLKIINMIPVKGAYMRHSPKKAS